MAAELKIMHNGGKDDNGVDKNLITPPMFAEMFRFMMGRDVCLLQSGFFSETSSDESYTKPRWSGHNFDITTNGLDFEISPGLAFVYGYFVYNETTRSFNIPPTGGNQYVWVYIEVDLSDKSIAKCNLAINNRGNDSSVWIEASTNSVNLIDQPNGKYILPLYKLEIIGNTITNITDPISHFVTLNAQLGRNLSVQSMVEITKLARLADEAKHARYLDDHNPTSTSNVEYKVCNTSTDNYGNDIITSSKVVDIDY